MSRNVVRSLRTALLRGYVLIVFLPMLVLGIIIMARVVTNNETQAIIRSEAIIRQFQMEMQMRLAEMEVKTQPFQYSQEIWDLLVGKYTRRLDQGYLIVRSVVPFCDHIKFSSQFIDSIQLYKLRDDVIEFKPYVLSKSALDKSIVNLDDLTLWTGKWISKIENNKFVLKYYVNIGGINNYIRRIGILELSVNGNMLVDSINLLHNSNTVFVFIINGILYRFSDGELSELPVSNPFSRYIENNSVNSKHELQSIDKQRYYVGLIYNNKLNISTYIFDGVPTINRIEFIILIFIQLILYISISLIYYGIIFKLSKDIYALGNHMINAGNEPENLEIYLYNKAKGYLEINNLTDYYNSMLNRIINLIEKLRTSEAQKKRALHYAFQEQVTPHFICNAFEDIRMLAITDSNEKVAHLAVLYGKYFRHHLMISNDLVTLSQEIDNIVQYVEICKYKISGRINLHIDIKQPVEKIMFPRTILQPIVENAVFHGYDRNIGALDITVFAKLENNVLIIRVSNNGILIPSEKLRVINEAISLGKDMLDMKTLNTGVGIININKRMREYFGREVSIKYVSSEREGTFCQIRILRGLRILDENSVD